MNKRRQIADSNPKNLTHFSGNSMSSSGLGVGGSAGGVGAAAAGGGINRSPINSNPELRAKSIIIGAGQPIIVPGQQINPTMANQTKSNANTQSTILSKVNSDAIASVRSSLHQNEHLQSVLQPTAAAAPIMMTTISDNKVTVEEFCPDGGGGLDKGFLDDLPGFSTNTADVRPQLDENGDSDSDNDNGNPLVAKFHEDPFDDFLTKGHNNSQQTVATAATSNAQIKSEPKINPLAKNKNKSSAAMVPDLSVILTPTLKRRSSNSSSEDIEIPHILKTKATSDSHGSDGQSNEEFDWLSDSNQRHSPDGGEDEASLPSIDKTVRSGSTLTTLSIDTKIDRLQLSDDGGGGDHRGGEGEAQSIEKQQSGEAKEKSKKKKKDKKEKKEKKEKKHGSGSGSGSGEKEKKRTKSKKSMPEDLLSENKERPSHSDRFEADDDQYEAL